MTLETAATSYPVEVSGWDIRTQFFVEHGEMRWDKEGNKFVSLRSPVRDGALVYVRLVSPTGTMGPILMAYKAEIAALQRSRDTFDVRLMPYQRQRAASAMVSSPRDSVVEFIAREKQSF